MTSRCLFQSALAGGTRCTSCFQVGVEKEGSYIWRILRRATRQGLSQVASSQRLQYRLALKWSECRRSWLEVGRDPVFVLFRVSWRQDHGCHETLKPTDRRCADRGRTSRPSIGTDNRRAGQPRRARDSKEREVQEEEKEIPKKVSAMSLATTRSMGRTKILFDRWHFQTMKTTSDQ